VLLTHSVSTNQTTLEHLAPFMLLRHLPPLPTIPQTPAAARTPDSSSVPPFVALHPPLGDTPIPTTPPRRSPSRDPTSPYYFPSPPPDGEAPLANSLSDAITSIKQSRLLEHELSSAQRKKIRRVHGKIRLYDLGWKQNVTEALGGGYRNIRNKGWKWWIRLFLVGGCGYVGKQVIYDCIAETTSSSLGDGYTFPFNPQAQRKLEKLASELALSN
jgi:palmitoyltransferase ZDHHC2/15/20